MDMVELAKTLGKARSRQKMTLESVSRAAKISPAYLHKLEAGRVQTPSPHVLRRLSSVLGVPYLHLMTLAGYLERSESAAAQGGRESTSEGRVKPMKQVAKSAVSTNAEIVRLLEAIRTELGELKRGQAELAKKLGTAGRHATKG